MKQVAYTLAIFALLSLTFLFSRIHDGVHYEHEFRFVREQDGCKLYAFKSWDGWKDKKHYYTTCKGEVVEPDEINVTDWGVTMADSEPKYISVYVNKDKSFEVNHVEDGSILVGVDSLVAAKAIALLACMGHLCRGDDGMLYISPNSSDDDVETIDEYMDTIEEPANDDAPESEDSDSELCPPNRGLEYDND